MQILNDQSEYVCNWNDAYKLIGPRQILAPGRCGSNCHM